MVKPATDVAPTKTTAISADNVDEKALYLNGEGTSDSEADAKAIVARILSATSEEDIFGGPGTIPSAEDMIGKPFTLHDVSYRESDIEGSVGTYALLTISPWGSTEQTLMTCGARNVMASAFRGKQRGLLPRGPLTIVEGKLTRKGFTPLWLQDMDKATADTMAGVQEVPFA